MPPSGRLSVRIHKADIPTTIQGDEQLQCAVKTKFGALATSPSFSSSTGNFQDELSFDLGPMDDSAHGTATFIVYKNTNSSRQELARGNVSLLQLSMDEPQNVIVPVKDNQGEYAGEVTATLRLFPSRSPGKVRDELGKEYIDAHLINQGPKGAAREMNIRSPRHSKQYTDEEDAQPDSLHFRA